MTKMYSQNVHDSFEIYVSAPLSVEPSTRYKVVYYCDANLKSGKELRHLLSFKDSFPNLKNTLFVGIGHIGRYRVLRRRDFVLPFIEGHDTFPKSKDYGHVKDFYAFMKDELIPSINAKFKTYKDSNSILGHSLGGLFAFYCLFRADSLFCKYFALSPALWIDKYSIYNFNNIHGGFSGEKYIYFAAGSKETKNKILYGTNDAKAFFDKMKYSNLSYEYQVQQGQTHNSEVPLSLRKILYQLL